MGSKIKNVMMILCILMMCLLIGYIIIQQRDLNALECTRIASDTILVTRVDTIKIEKIKYKEKIVLDSIFVHDTIMIRELIHYKDSLIDLYVSGIDTKIDSLTHYYKRDSIFVNTTVEKTIILKKKIGLTWTVGPYVGYGATINGGKIYASPSVGICGSIGIGGIIR